MRSCLIGHTGFVGGNLAVQNSFSAKFNSKNISEIRNEAFDIAVCAGVSATMWKANNDPEADWKAISGLIECLRAAELGAVVLVSTVAVLDNLSARYTERNSRFEESTPYGMHRRQLEKVLQDEFSRVHILRLPALHGAGLKKNFLFDLLNPAPSFLKREAFDELIVHAPETLKRYAQDAYQYDQDLNMYAFNRQGSARDQLAHDFEFFLQENLFDSRRFTNHNSTYQFYDLTRLWGDIQSCLEHDVRELNLVTEAVSANDLAERVTGKGFSNDRPATVTQDVRTIHDQLLGGSNGYIYSAEEVLDRIDQFTRHVAGQS